MHLLHVCLAFIHALILSERTHPLKKCKAWGTTGKHCRDLTRALIERTSMSQLAMSGIFGG